MATKNQQPETAEKTTTQFLSIEELRDKKKMSSSDFSGICAAYGWRPGKMVTEEEFDIAIKKFSNSPIGKKVN